MVSELRPPGAIRRACPDRVAATVGARHCRRGTVPARFPSSRFLLLVPGCPFREPRGHRESPCFQSSSLRGGFRSRRGHGLVPLNRGLAVAAGPVPAVECLPGVVSPVSMHQRERSPGDPVTWTSVSRSRRLCQDRPGPMNEPWHGTRCSPRRWVRDRLLRHPRLPHSTVDYSKESDYCSQLLSYVTSRCRELRQHEPSTR
jgi:hypothetical protein